MASTDLTTDAASIPPVEAVPAPESDSARFEEASEVAERFVANIETVVYGKREEIKLVLAALVCGGHVLLEDVPGTAKTVLARAIAGTIDGATPSRIQCTPDLQPTDVTGLSVFDQKTRDFEFRPGPIFANVVLVDEINRATPKTQSALLEAMAEYQVTVDGVTRELPRRSSCSPRRTRSNTKEHSRSPRRSSTASSSAPRSATRGSRTSSGSSSSSASRTRSPTSSRPSPSRR